MKRIALLLVLGIFFLGGWAFSENATSASEVPPPGPKGPAWYYCQEVNPKSPNCMEMRRLMREHWKKMAETRENLWNEMEGYCQKHPKERFSRHLKRWKRWNCPCPCPKGPRARCMEGC